MASPSKFDYIACKELILSGSPTTYQLKPKSEVIGTLKRKILGEKDESKQNKTILLVGETGAGKSTIINALVNYTMGVKWEDDVWFKITEEEETSQSESQTTDVIVYQIFGFEGKTLPFSLTIIDTPGFGDTRGLDRDAIIIQRLYDWFRLEDGISEISAVGLVLKASMNRLTERLLYVLNSVTSLFGKDVEKNIVALITHSDGIKPKNALKALEEAIMNTAKDEKLNQIVYFLFNNCQSEDRTEDAEVLEGLGKISLKGLKQFTEFVDKIKPQKLKKTKAVLNERIRLEACIQNLQERITFIQEKKGEIQNVQKALADHEQQMKENEKFTVEVEKVFKVKEKIVGGRWWLVFSNGATICNVCKENCHRECTVALSVKLCEVMRRGRCTSCTGKCPVSAHEKGDWIYVTKKTTDKMTNKEMKKKFEDNKDVSESEQSLLENLKEKMKELEMEKARMLDESFQHVVKLEEIALNILSLSTLAHLDFLIDKMKESKQTEKMKKLEEIKSRVDERTRSALHKTMGMVKSGIDAAFSMLKS